MSPPWPCSWPRTTPASSPDMSISWTPAGASGRYDNGPSEPNGGGLRMAGPTGGSGPDIAGADKVNMAFIALIVAVATIGGFMFGYDSGVINGTQDGLGSAFNLSALGTGFNVGAILLGCAFGAFAAGRLADLIGRKTVM